MKCDCHSGYRQVRNDMRCDERWPDDAFQDAWGVWWYACQDCSADEDLVTAVFSGLL